MIPPYAPSLPDWQRQVANQLNSLFQRINVDYNNTPFGSSYYLNAQISLNGATPDAWYSALQGGTTATDALTAAALVSSTATNHQTNAIAGYVQSNRAQPANGGDVAGYFQAVSNASSSAVFPLNTVAADTPGKTGQIIGNELDFNVNAADTTVNGFNTVIVNNTSGALTGTRLAYAVRGVFSANSQWTHGYYTADGAIDGAGFAAFFGSQTTTTGTNRESQKLAFASYNAANTRFIATIRGDRNGGIQFQPGGSGGAHQFMNAAANAFLAYIDTNGITIPEYAAASVAAPAAGYQTLFIDTLDHKLKRKDSTGTVTIIA